MRQINLGAGTNAPKAAIYCRLSEEDRHKQRAGDDSGSIANQKQFLTWYANEHGWVIYDIYSDDDYAGSDRSRPDFNRLLRDAEARKFDIILCKTQHRFTREMELVEKYLHYLFPLWGIRFISPVDGADTSVLGNKKSRQINGLVNEWYLEDLSASIKTALTTRRQAGFHIGAFAPYGYKKDPETKGHLVIDEPAAAIVRLIFKLFEAGFGKTAIARHLNDRGEPNPTEYKRLNGIRTKAPSQQCATLWKYTTIADILCNEVYIGTLVQNRYESVSWKMRKCRPTSQDKWIRVANCHEPIISQDQWERVQALLGMRTKPFNCGTVGLFARTARCAHCGYILRTSKSKDNRSYLQCPNHHIAKDACIGSFISVERLERLVLDEYCRLVEEYLDKDAFEQGLDFEIETKEERQRLLDAIKHHQQEADARSLGIKNLLKSNARGAISEDDLLAATQELADERTQLLAQIESCTAELTALEQRIAAGDNRREVFEKYTCPEHLDRAFVESLIKSIYVWKRIPGTREIPIKIEWNF